MDALAPGEPPAAALAEAARALLAAARRAPGGP